MLLKATVYARADEAAVDEAHRNMSELYGVALTEADDTFERGNATQATEQLRQHIIDSVLGGQLQKGESVYVEVVGHVPTGGVEL